MGMLAATYFAAIVASCRILLQPIPPPSGVVQSPIYAVEFAAEVEHLVRSARGRVAPRQAVIFHSALDLIAVDREPVAIEPAQRLAGLEQRRRPWIERRRSKRVGEMPDRLGVG